MPAITQNKLAPVLVIAALAIIGYVLYGRVMNGSGKPAAKAAPTMQSVPRADGTVAEVRTGGLLGLGALSASAPQRRADADTPGETLKTVTASNNELRAQFQQLLEANQSLMRDNANLRADQATIVAKAKEQVLVELKAQNPAPAAVAPLDGPARSATGSTGAPRRQPGIGDFVDSATDGVSKMMGSLSNTNGAGVPTASGIPNGLGYDAGGSGTPAGSAGAASLTTSYTRVLPLGFKEATSGSGQVGIVRTNGMPISERTSAAGNAVAAYRAATGGADTDADDAAPSSKKTARPPKPYYTIPENSTLSRGTMMTALVGRIPIDGRVQDPMQFKLLIGRENLAANGQFVPDDIAGVVVTGIAIGDMALSCVEGHVQSLTFIFEDGSVHTVSLKKNGAIGATGSGSGGTPSLAQTNKLGWLSDEFGNPCIAGRFVTNAPAYLTDIVGLKTLSIAAQASSLAQTTTSASPLGSTSSVTGSKGAFVLGQAASSGVDEVTSWITRRLNNSFDAVVAPAGVRVALHVEQEIAIDKASDARKLDYARSARAAGVARHGLD